jgi:hypothetical protein
MSRTPEQIENKAAKKVQEYFYGAGVISGFASYVGFENGNNGLGLILALLAVSLIWGGSKIKTTHDKKGEVGVYK